MTVIEIAFAPLRDLPCWNARIGYASRLSLNFGEPSLEMTEVRGCMTLSRKIRQPRRTIQVIGEWHFTTDHCDWIFYSGDKRVGGSNSTDRIKERAARAVNGAKLLTMTLEPTASVTAFHFEFGGKLTLYPYRTRRGGRPAVSDNPGQWELFEPFGYCLTVCNDRTYSHQPGDTPTDELIYLPLFP